MLEEIFCEIIISFFSEACKEQGNFERNKKQRKKFQDELIKKLSKICNTETGYKKSENLRFRLIGKNNDQLFTFIMHSEIPPTNNLAERGLRNVVIHRKICFGTRSKKGSEVYSILSSLIATAKKQGVDYRDFLISLFTQDTKSAINKLYKNTS